MTIASISNGESGSSIRTKLNTIITQYNAVLENLVVPSSSAEALTLVNSWVNFGSGWMDAVVWLDANNYAHIFGRIKDGTTTPGTTITTLPSGRRPAAALRGVTVSNGAIGEVALFAGGALQIISGSATAFSLWIPPFKVA